ncbi:MAG: phosphoribosylaminoimidazolesuccinocarboxamide synthase, partial [Dactylosporangium sp.]|nr:phosphoribosylaminoimidazolesuccinocarboxamide synthase [Dactylosporangium sp.]NNJ60941.1 phosphoribosylaminoimidazolesuccinocarboxamide synthase [Dactylosporangium sp.]
SRLPEPIFTPTTKAAVGAGHDESMTYDDVVAQVGEDLAQRLRRITLEVYRTGSTIAAERGIIIADTKLEFGVDPSGALVLADEVLTPDSSRFWLASDWQPGRTPTGFDKQHVRDWATGTGWNKQPPAPDLPPEVVELTRARYAEAYKRITGESWR